MIIGLRDNYEEIRAPYVRDGMDKTSGEPEEDGRIAKH
jgi:hypothetical protein